MSIQYNYTQPYSNWFTPSWMQDARRMEMRARVFDLTSTLDELEREVYRDRDFNMACDMLEAIGVKIG